MSVSPRSRRAYAWLSCAAKTCCERGRVHPTSNEITEIAAGLGIDAGTFVTPEGELVTTERGCVFLLRLASGVGRCGLGDLAPSACQRFPADEAGLLRADHGCVCREWTQRDLDPP